MEKFVFVDAYRRIRHCRSEMVRAHWRRYPLQKGTARTHSPLS